MPLVIIPVTPPRLNDSLSFNLGLSLGLSLGLGLSLSFGLNLGNSLVVRGGFGRGTGVAGRAMA